MDGNRLNQMAENFYEEVMRQTISDFIDNKLTLKSAAMKVGISPLTFKVFALKYLRSTEEERKKFSFTKYESSQVFSNVQENVLREYLVAWSRIHYGLTPKGITTLAYNFAKRNNNLYPLSWEKNKQAGAKWLKGFRQRCVEFTVKRKYAEFDLKECITDYFNNLSNVYDNLPTGPSRQNIFYLDETHLTTLYCNHRIGEETCDGRGAKVKAFCFINAMGCTIPPFLIYPNEHYNEKMLAGAPRGTRGIPAKKCSNDVLFLDMLKHFHESVKSTPELPVVFIFYNHEVETSIETLEFCRNHGIILISLPPNSREVLQPLCKSLNTNFVFLRNDRLLKDPTKIVNIYDIGELLGTAFQIVYQRRTIMNAFELTGIWPFNRRHFDYLRDQ